MSVYVYGDRIPRFSSSHLVPNIVIRVVPSLFLFLPTSSHRLAVGVPAAVVCKALLTKEILHDLCVSVVVSCVCPLLVIVDCGHV